MTSHATKYGVLLLLLIAAITGCSSANKLFSRYESSVIIDGNQIDWKDNLKFDKDNQIAVGFMNDEENLYMAVVASQGVNSMTILNRGLVVWLESEKSSERIGIRFPYREDNERLPVLGPQAGNKNNSADEMRRRIDDIIRQQDEITIVNEDGFPLYAFPKNSAKGFAAGLDISMGQLVYELRVPLGGNNSSQYVFNANPGESILVEIKSGEMKEPQRGKGMSAAPGQQPMGEAFGRGPGGRMGKGPGKFSELNKEVDYEAEVKLSNQN